MAPLLTETKIKSLKPKKKPYKVYDLNGLFLDVRPTGKKIWRIKYTQNHKSKTLTIGEYPFITLLDARKSAFDFKKKLQLNEQISVKKFKDVSSEFFKTKKLEWSEKYLKSQQKKIENYVLEIIGHKQINEISKTDINLILENIVKKKLSKSRIGPKVELRSRVFNLIKQIFRFAINKDYVQHNVCDLMNLKDILPNVEVNHIQAILNETEFRSMVKALFSLEGVYPTTLWALQFLILTALRSNNVRKMQWSWLDKDKKIITIPSKELKTRKEFRVPLTNTLYQIILDAEKIKKSNYIFYSPTHPNRPLSENVFITLLKRLGIQNHRPHGFRSSFSTFCYENQREHGFSSEVIETQLTHSIGNLTTRAYLRSDFLEERRKLLEWWEQFIFK